MKILTFDIEEWFHILDNESTKTEKEWSKYETRIHHNIDRILLMLSEKNQKATFFCLGWIAEKHPDVVKKIDSEGHEIGSHSHMHQLVYEQSPDEFRKDLDRSIKLLEDVTGKRINTYRSPGFSLKQNCMWAFDIMAELGIEKDCSIFPAYRSHGGIPGFSIKKPFIIQSNGNSIKEFPMSVFRLSGFNMAFSGGGYFRLLPYKIIKRIVQKEDYVMTYFHPRDFDEGQPLIENLSLIRRFKSYYGLSSSFQKLEKMLSEFDFIALSKASERINWRKTTKIKI